ncbi:MAG: DUF4396 domain-containing protein, partial [Burkholderiales bacterium]|nr:DUF4396 domain-containing protein [Burkholderiales bacterium]
MATLHCLAGCAIGEVAGMVIGTALGWSNAATIGLARKFHQRGGETSEARGFPSVCEHL